MTASNAAYQFQRRRQPHTDDFFADRRPTPDISVTIYLDNTYDRDDSPGDVVDDATSLEPLRKHACHGRIGARGIGV